MNHIFAQNSFRDTCSIIVYIWTFECKNEYMLLFIFLVRNTIYAILLLLWFNCMFYIVMRMILDNILMVDYLTH